MATEASHSEDDWARQAVLSSLLSGFPRLWLGVVSLFEAGGLSSMIEGPLSLCIVRIRIVVDSAEPTPPASRAACLPLVGRGRTGIQPRIIRVHPSICCNPKSGNSQTKNDTSLTTITRNRRDPRTHNIRPPILTLDEVPISGKWERQVATTIASAHILVHSGVSNRH